MDALILSCSTGGGHNAASLAIKEELENRGHTVTMFDPFILAESNLDHKVGNTYDKLVQYAPRMFGCLYHLGQCYSSLSIPSPVYYANRKTAGLLREYLDENPVDVVICCHLYPSEMLTYLKNEGYMLPKTIFVATDYTCIPFIEELSFDYCVVPTKKLIEDFASKGIDKSKLVPLGIPVKKAFYDTETREEAIKNVGLDPNKHYILLSGGSIGAGKITRTVFALKYYIKKSPDRVLIVICGRNKKLYRELQVIYKNYSSQIILIESTNQMADYMKASDFFISKPGGLSSTEAAVLGVPLIHVTPIPGCESKNIRYFKEQGLSIGVGNKIRKLPKALKQVQDSDFTEQMIDAQRKEINPFAASDICDLAESVCS